MADMLKNCYDFSLAWNFVNWKVVPGNLGLTKFWLILLYFARNVIPQISEVCQYGPVCDIS